MKVLLAVIYLFIHHVCANDVTVDLGPVELSASIGSVPPLYKPLQSDDKIATANAISHLEWLRHKFNTGSGHLPPLDPFEISHIGPISFQNGAVTGQVNLYDLHIEGAKEFALNLAEVRMKIHTVTENIDVPEIVATVHFNADILLTIVPMTLTGDLKVVLKGVNVAGSFATESTPNGAVEVYRVTGTDVNVKADDLEVTLTDLSLDVDENMVRNWWNILKQDIANEINNAVVFEINSVLQYYTTKQVDDFLLSP